MKKSTPTTLIGIFVFVTVFLTPSFNSSALYSDSKGREEQVGIGDIIVSGRMDQNGNCELPPFTVTTYPPEDYNPNEYKWLSLEINDDCELIVVAEWTGTFEDGPALIIEPLQWIIDNSKPIIVPIELPDRNVNAIQNLELPTKTSQQLVYTYGYGGTADKLTKLTTNVTFTWDGSVVYVNHRGGTCQGGSFMSWSWVVDSCYQLTYVPGPGPYIIYDAGGNYHCAPTGQWPCNASNPDGYYHSLFSYIEATKNGSSLCQFGASGAYVFGPKRNILQGCN